ncbi:MAG TPA: hypothetical protein PLA68_11915, partial [Panacibacter sp.]|nr:hypothetical protein [Panacibacter sp.]
MFSIAGTSQPGSLDSSFGNDGIAFVSRDLADCNSLALQQDGKVVSASSSVINSTNGFTLSRTNPDGSIDLSFGNDGLVFTGIPGGGVVVES